MCVLVVEGFCGHLQALGVKAFSVAVRFSAGALQFGQLGEAYPSLTSVEELNLGLLIHSHRS